MPDPGDPLTILRAPRCATPGHHDWCAPDCAAGLPSESSGTPHRGHVRQVIVGGVMVGTVWITQSNGRPPMLAQRAQREMTPDAADAYAAALIEVAAIRRNLT